MDWDDVRYFLAVARSPTVRLAAERLGVNHSTVLRRIAHLEEQLGTHLFERLPSGYRLTDAGTEVLDLAAEMEATSHRFQARIAGRDQSVGGSLRVAVPPTLATYLLAPAFAAFARLYPEVELEVLASYEPVNLTNREADVAVRVVYDRATLPLNLHGARGPALMSGVYVARERLAARRDGAEVPVRWVVRGTHDIPDWPDGTGLRLSDVPFRTNDPESQIAAVHQGIGIATLPCFIGDADPRLARVPGAALRTHGVLWVLTQGETRKTRRVRLFTEFVGRRLAAHAALLGGRSPQADGRAAGA